MGPLTYTYDIVGIGAVEVGDPYARRQRFLPLECLVKALAKVGLDAQRLEYEHAHAHQTLL